jgi:hypothetical protein
MLPMSIGDDSPQPSKWNRGILVFCWSAEALILLFKQFLFLWLLFLSTIFGMGGLIFVLYVPLTRPLIFT